MKYFSEARIKIDLVWSKNDFLAKLGAIEYFAPSGRRNVKKITKNRVSDFQKDTFLRITVWIPNSS